jgi:hypothetical protein
MKSEVKIYNLKDPKQYEDEKSFWDSQSIEYKLNVLESIRESWIKLNDNGKSDENLKGLRRVVRIVKMKK